MAENFQVRDVFNPAVVRALGQQLKTVWPDFAETEFCENICARLPKLSYSERSKLITDGLSAHLPSDFQQAVEILLKALPPEIETEELTGYERFIILPQTMFIVEHGLAHFELSMQALYEMTKRFSSEYAIRFFIEKYPVKTINRLALWARDPNVHVRRLVAEGSRPLLPWALRLNRFVKNPAPALYLLNLLSNDPSLYVRRSVANHLNDHAKNYPELVVETLKKWKADHPGKEMDWLVKHATRTLVKQGHPGALKLMGFKKGAELKVENLAAASVVEMGGYLEFSFDVVSTGKSTQNLVIDYVIYFKKADASLAPKVFKMTTRQLAPGERIALQKRHSFRKITTRVYYPGEHAVAVQVNGKEIGKVNFVLK